METDPNYATQMDGGYYLYATGFNNAAGLVY